MAKKDVVIDLEIRVSIEDFASINLESAMDEIRGYGACIVKNVRTEEVKVDENT